MKDEDFERPSGRRQERLLVQTKDEEGFWVTLGTYGSRQKAERAAKDWNREKVPTRIIAGTTTNPRK